MKILSAIAFSSLLGMLLIVAGCQRESSSQKKTTVETPEGKTTVTEKTTVEKTGKNPPPAPDAHDPAAH